MASTSGSFSGSESSGNVSMGTANGFLYGLGFKQLITDNVYVGIDAYQVAFSSKSSTMSDSSGNYQMSNKPNMTYGGINLGYKF